MPSEKRLRIRGMAKELVRTRANPEILEEWKRSRRQQVKKEGPNASHEKLNSRPPTHGDTD